MTKLSLSIIFLLALFGIGCESGKDPFGCSKSEVPKTIDIQLGEAGETNIENKLPENKKVKALKEDESINFISDDGEAEIIHHKDRKIEVGDIIVANPTQKYLVQVKEVKQNKTGSTIAVLRQARISDIVGENSGSLKIETSPIYSLEDIGQLNKQAQQAAKNGESVYKIDDQGRIVIRNLDLFSIDLNSSGRIKGGNNTILGIPVKNPYESLSIRGGAGGRYRARVNEATIHVHPTIRSEADWELGKIAKLQTRLDTKVTYKVDLTFEAAGFVNIQALFKKFMPKKPFLFVPPVPYPSMSTLNWRFQQDYH